MPPNPGKTPDVRPVIDPEDDPFKTYGPKEKEEKPADKPVEKPAPPKTAKPTDKPTDKPADKPPVEKTEEKPGRKTGWQMFHEQEKKTQALQEENAKLQRQIGEKSAPGKIDDHPDFKSTREKLARMEKQYEELQDKIRFVDYESSDEYKQKFHQPYVQAWEQAIHSIEQMNVAVEEGQAPRTATRQDLQRIVSAKNVEEASQIAEQLFGPNAKASYAIQLRDRILQKHQDALAAREEFKTKGIEQSRLTEKQQQEQAEARAQSFTKAVDEAVEKYPKWFKPEEGDTEGNELLEIGTMLADAAFGGQIKDGKTGELRDPTPDEIPLLHAQMRNKAAGFDRLAYKFNKAQKRITELEELLGQYEGTEPGGGEVPSGQTKGKEDDEDPFAKFERK